MSHSVPPVMGSPSKSRKVSSGWGHIVVSTTASRLPPPASSHKTSALSARAESSHQSLSNGRKSRSGSNGTVELPKFSSSKDKDKEVLLLINCNSNQCVKDSSLQRLTVGFRENRSQQRCGTEAKKKQKLACPVESVNESEFHTAGNIVRNQSKTVSLSSNLRPKVTTSVQGDSNSQTRRKAKHSSTVEKAPAVLTNEGVNRSNVFHLRRSAKVSTAGGSENTYQPKYGAKPSSVNCKLTNRVNNSAYTSEQEVATKRNHGRFKPQQLASDTDENALPVFVNRTGHEVRTSSIIRTRKSEGCAAADATFNLAKKEILKVQTTRNKYREKNSACRHRSVNSAVEIATESSSEHLAFPRRDKPKGDGRFCVIDCYDDFEQSGIDADLSSSDQCDDDRLTQSLELCDGTYVVDESIGNESTRIDTKTALTIAYDVDNSDTPESCGTMPPFIKQSGIGLLARSYSGARGQCAKAIGLETLHSGRAFTADQSSLGIIGDTELCDDSLLPIGRMERDLHLDSRLQCSAEHDVDSAVQLKTNDADSVPSPRFEFANIRKTSTPRGATLPVRSVQKTRATRKLVKCEVTTDTNDNRHPASKRSVQDELCIVRDASYDDDDVEAKVATGSVCVNGASLAVCGDRLRNCCSEETSKDRATDERNYSAIENAIGSGSAERLEFEVFDENDFLGSQMQLCDRLVDITGAGEEQYEAVDVTQYDAEMLSAVGWHSLPDKSFHNLCSTAASGEVIRRQKSVAVQSNSRVKPGAGEVLMSYLPAADSTSDLFGNWSFSSIGRPSSAESNSCDVPARAVESLNKTVSVGVQPEHRARSGRENCFTAMDQQSGNDGLYQDEVGFPKDGPITITSAPNDYIVSTLDGKSNLSSASSKRRLPVLKSTTSMLRPPGSSLKDAKQLPLPRTNLSVLEVDDNRGINVIVEMERQVTEKVIGFAASHENIYSASRIASTNDLEGNVRNAAITSATSPEGRGTTTAQIGPKSVDRPLSARSANDVGASKKPSPVLSPRIPRSSVGSSVQKPNGERSSNASSALGRHISVTKRFGLEVAKDTSNTSVGGGGAAVKEKTNRSSSISAGLTSSTQPASRTVASSLLRCSVSDTQQSAAAATAAQQVSAAKFAATLSKPSSRLLPPTVSKLQPSVTKASTAVDVLVKSSAVENQTVAAAKLPGDRTRLELGRAPPEPRSSVGRQSMSSAASDVSPRVHVPTRKSSLTSNLGADLRRAELRSSVNGTVSNGFGRTAPRFALSPRTPNNQPLNKTASEMVVRPKRSSTGSIGLSDSNIRQLDAALKLQLSHCSSPSSHSQSSIASEKSSQSSIHTATSNGTRASEAKEAGAVSIKVTAATVRRQQGSKSVRADDQPKTMKTSNAEDVTNSARLHIPLPASKSFKAIVHTSSLHAKESNQLVVDGSKSSSFEQLSVSYPHQPDLVTNSVLHKESSSILHHLEIQCTTLSAQLSALRSTLKQRTCGFEAMATLVQYLSEQNCPLTLRRLKSELLSAKSSLTEAVSKAGMLMKQRDALILEIQNMKEDHEVQLNALTVTHEMAMHSLVERHESELNKRLAAESDAHQSAVNLLKAENEQVINKLSQTHQKAVAEKEQEMTSKLIDLDFSHKRKTAELQRKHDGQIKELKSQFEHEKTILMGKIDRLKADFDKLHQQTNKPQSPPNALVSPPSPCPEIDPLSCEIPVCHSPTTPTSPTENMLHEIDSLKIVLDLRNSEINKLKTTNAELEKQLLELPAARETIQRLQQKLENAEAIVSMKVDYEKEMSEKHQALLRLYDQETKDNKRLSMDNEQLMWRLSQEGLAAPLTPLPVRRTFSNPAPNKSAPGTPNLLRRRDRSSLGPPPTNNSRPLSQSDFDNITFEDFEREDQEYY